MGQFQVQKDEVYDSQPISLAGAFAFIRYGVAHDGDDMSRDGRPDGAFRGKYIPREVKHGAIGRQAYLLMEISVFNSVWRSIGQFCSEYPEEVFSVMERFVRGVFSGTIVSGCMERFKYYRDQLTNPQSPIGRYIAPATLGAGVAAGLNETIETTPLLQPYCKGLQPAGPPRDDLTTWFGYSPEGQFITDNGVMASRDTIVSPSALKLKKYGAAGAGNDWRITDPLDREEEVITWTFRVDRQSSIISSTSGVAMVQGEAPVNPVIYDPLNFGLNNGNTLVLSTSPANQTERDSQALIIRMLRDRLGNSSKIELDLSNPVGFIDRINAHIRLEAIDRDQLLQGQNPSINLTTLLRQRDGPIRHVFFKDMAVMLDDVPAELEVKGIGREYSEGARIMIEERSRGRGLSFSTSGKIKLNRLVPVEEFHAAVRSHVAPVLSCSANYTDNVAAANLLGIIGAGGTTKTPWRTRLKVIDVADQDPAVPGAVIKVPFDASPLLRRTRPTSIKDVKRLPLTFELESELGGLSFVDPESNYDPGIWCGNLIEYLDAQAQAQYVAAPAAFPLIAAESTKLITRAYVPIIEWDIMPFGRYASMQLSTHLSDYMTA